MLPPFIIEQLLRRGRIEQPREQRQQLELPLVQPPSGPTSDELGSQDSDRGVIVISLWD